MQLKILIPTFLILFIVSYSGFTQPCTITIDTISRQGQIDSFNIKYPGCTKVAGNLVITVPFQIWTLYTLSDRFPVLYRL